MCQIKNSLLFFERLKEVNSTEKRVSVHKRSVLIQIYQTQTPYLTGKKHFLMINRNIKESWRAFNISGILKKPPKPFIHFFFQPFFFVIKYAAEMQLKTREKNMFISFFLNIFCGKNLYDNKTNKNKDLKNIYFSNFSSLLYMLIILYLLR